jgi:aspartate beta-hydroxylase
MTIFPGDDERAASVVTPEVRRRYAELVDGLLRDGRQAAAERIAQLAVDEGVWTDPLQRPTDLVPYGSRRPVYQPHDYWFVHHLEAHYPQIRAEIDAVSNLTRPGFEPVEEPLLAAGRWEQVVLYEAGRRQDSACARFPVTASVVEQIPEATTFGPGVVTLSRLEPGAHVIPHCGRTNSQLRVHLGLDVPTGVSIRVGDQHLSWRDGECIVFDDSYEHEVWHRGDRPRLILLMDVLYPDLSEEQRREVLARRASASSQIAGYLADQGIRRIEVDDVGVVMRPGPGTSALVRRYLAEAGASAVELRDGSLHFEYPEDDGR